MVLVSLPDYFAHILFHTQPTGPSEEYRNAAGHNVQSAAQCARHAHESEANSIAFQVLGDYS